MNRICIKPEDQDALFKQICKYLKFRDLVVGKLILKHRVYDNN